MTSKLYILSEDGQTPILAESVDDWVSWVEKTPPTVRRVALTTLDDQCVVSTVFLGDGSGTWETMIFRPHSWEEKDMYRCTGNREQAEAMHEKMVAKYGKLLPSSQGPAEVDT